MSKNTSDTHSKKTSGIPAKKASDIAVKKIIDTSPKKNVDVSSRKIVENPGINIVYVASKTNQKDIPATIQQKEHNFLGKEV